MKLRTAALGVLAAGLWACSSSSSNVVCESAVCGLGPTLIIRGQTRTAAAAPVADVSVLAAGFIGACGTANLAEYSLVPPATASDSSGYYLFGIEPKRERIDVCLRLRAIHGSDTITLDTNGLSFIPPPSPAESLTVNFVFP